MAEKIEATVETTVTIDGESRTLFLNGTVDQDNTKELIEAIYKFNDEDDRKGKNLVKFDRQPIKLIVNTYGGYAYDGFGLVGVIEQSKTPVHTYVHGKAMSAGLAIALAGHKRYAGKYATFMYHQVLTGAWGKIEQIKEDLGEAERLCAIYDGIVLGKSNIRKDDLERVKERRADWFIGADEALKLGIIDEII